MCLFKGTQEWEMLEEFIKWTMMKITIAQIDNWFYIKNILGVLDVRKFNRKNL